MGPPEIKEKRVKRRRRNFIARELQNRKFRQRRIDKDYKLKRVKEIEEANDIDIYSD